MRSVVLVGFMGAGKSAVARVLSSTSGHRIVDTDAIVEQEAGMRISEIFEILGEQTFRDLEQRAVFSIDPAEDLIVSTGGGVVGRDANVSHLKSLGKVVHLQVSFDEASRRCSGSNRPLFEDLTDAKDLFTERAPLYMAAADVVVRTDGLTPEAVAEAISQAVA